MRKFAGQLVGRDHPRLQAEPAPEVYGGCRVFYRGYIANAAALGAESQRRGEPFEDSSFGALFAKAYHWWGEGLQSRVLGEYAVAVFDEGASKLLLTHDGLGLVPVFYLDEPGSFAFASHLTELVALGGAHDLDAEYIADFLATGQAISARTPYRRIRRLLPGYSLLFDNQRAHVRNTWDIAAVEPLTLGDDAEYAERFRALLGEGVQAAVASEGKVWCELSGGLDSSSLLCVAARMSGELEAISFVCKSARGGDESEWMKAVVAEYALPWHTFDVDDARAFSELPDRFFAEPSCGLAEFALQRRYRALVVSHGVRVILSGEGGDQVCFGGRPKPYYLADFLPWRVPRLLSSLRRWHASDPHKRSSTYLFLANVARPSFRYLMRRNVLSHTALGVPDWIDRDYRRRMRLDKRNVSSLVPRCRCVGQQYFAETVAEIGMVPTFAWESGADSVEVRKPFLYRPLVEFMMAIPWEQNLQPDQDRVLQRRALAGILPEAIRQRTDKRSTMESYFEGLRDGSLWTERLLNRPRVVERGYVDERLWRETVHRARYARIRSTRHFMATASLELWLRQLEDRKPEVPRALAAIG